MPHAPANLRRLRLRAISLLAALIAAAVMASARCAHASTYVVYIPLDSPIYEELDTLNGLGYLDDYLSEIKPISRVEAARLSLEAMTNLSDSPHADPLAADMVGALRQQLRDEIGWLESNHEDNPPTQLHPIDRFEAEYVFSRGAQRLWNTGGGTGLVAKEGTPLLPNNDGIPTAPGSNEILRLGAWGGFGGFLTGYGEAAVTGPITYTPNGMSRFRPLDAEAVLSLGNWAVSFGQEEMWWGAGHFGSLSQGDNAMPFPALRVQNVHPKLLPGVFRYLGQFRFQAFFGQLDGGRTFAHPWIDGQIFSFKPTPDFEFGFTHTIMFGGTGNDNYGWTGFVGRATGFATGSAQVANTNSRGGVYLKFYFPSLRNLQVYQEILGEDNLTKEVPAVGRFLPFLAVSYQGGIYLPRLSADGRTDLRVEYSILEPNYSVHSDSLYWSYEDQLMGDPLGPNASQVDVQIGRWLKPTLKLSGDVYYTERAPTFGSNTPYPLSIYSLLSKEHSGGIAFDFLRIPGHHEPFHSVLTEARGRFAIEYVNRMNYGGPGGFRAMVMLGVGAIPKSLSLEWQ
jgi:hypothetical protein